MARTYLTMPFADGDYTFRLGLAQIRELQTKVGAGIGEIYARVLHGRMGDELEEGALLMARFHIDDNRETVRQALIGGSEGRVEGADVKVSAPRAKELVERYFDTLPVKDQWDMGAAILYALVEGYSDGAESDDELDEDDESKKKEGGSTTKAP